MKVIFRYAWSKGPVTHKNFKSEACYKMVEEYSGRINHFAPCSLSGLPAPFKKNEGSALWLCDTSKKAKALSSRELADHLRKLENSSTREWHIAIGASDGFDDAARSNPSVDLLWSFGPQTLPHELAAVVAAEQVYRAYTILRNLPYHSGH